MLINEHATEFEEARVKSIRSRYEMSPFYSRITYVIVDGSRSKVDEKAISKSRHVRRHWSLLKLFLLSQFPLSAGIRALPLHPNKTPQRKTFLGSHDGGTTFRLVLPLHAKLLSVLTKTVSVSVNLSMIIVANLG